MRILFFGSYEADRHPRIRVLAQGFRTRGDDVVEVNVPLGLGAAKRVELVRQPWRAPAFLARLGSTWVSLVRRARAVRQPDAVVVGYLGHLDVHLARRLWPGIPLVLDHLVSLADTARDRRVGGAAVRWLLEKIDAAATGASELVLVDTEEHRDLLPAEVRDRGVVVPVGAPEEWFAAARISPAARTSPFRVVFFGLYTPLQGTPVIGDAIAALRGEPVEFLMIGRGQEFEETRRRAADNSSVTWVDWVDPDDLPERVAACHVCLGIFGTGPKALRVVPNKVYQGAAAGCAVVTSETPPQRRALDGGAVFVPPGDADGLAEALRRLARDPGRLEEWRGRARRRARSAFRPGHVVHPLRDRLVGRNVSGAAGRSGG